jgi:transcriptional regulator with XRE-family HTH domain
LQITNLANTLTNMVSPSTPGTRAAERARAAIRDAGYTRHAFAEKLGIPYGTLGRKLTGRRSISPEELIEISNVLSIRPSALLADADPDEQAVS